jgi:membrane-anchored protein YejM (alkaline phosphatase superfamily)
VKGAGYRTGAFVGAFVLDARFGLSRGFDEYDDRYPHEADTATFKVADRRAAEVVKAAGDWILGAAAAPAPAAGAPWFAWVHLYDPHSPYDAPPEYRAGRSPYDAEVAYTDAMLGQLLDRLAAARALDRTLVVVTADHGESLGDHGETTHGLFAYGSTLSVPLILSGAPAGHGVVDVPVAHADLLPTILDLVAAAPPRTSTAGPWSSCRRRPAVPKRWRRT